MSCPYSYTIAAKMLSCDVVDLPKELVAHLDVIEELVELSGGGIKSRQVVALVVIQYKIDLAGYVNDIDRRLSDLEKEEGK